MAVSSVVRKTIERVQMWRTREYPCIDLCKKVFKLFGVWHTRSGQKGFGKVIMYLLPRLPLYVSVYGIFAGSPMLAYQNQEKNIQHTVEVVSVMCIGCVMCCIFGSLLYRPQQLDRLFVALEEIKECSLKLTERPANVLGSNRKMGEFLLYCLVFGFTLLALSITPLPLMIQKRKLIVDHWYPFDAKASPAYEIIVVYTTLAHVVGMGTLLAFHTMLMAMCLEGRGQFLLLSHNLAGIKGVDQVEKAQGNVVFNESSALAPPKKRRDPGEEIKVCVELHYSILRFVREVESTFNLHLCMFLICTLIPSGMCILLMFYDQSGDKYVIRVFMILGSNCGTIICCWLGNELTVQEEAVREAIYDCAWIDQSESFKRSMRMIMSRSNQPVVIKVAGFVSLSMETYYAMTKLTYSYTMAMWGFFKESVAK